NVWYHSHGAEFDRWSEAPHILEDIYNFEDALLVGLILISMLRHSDRVKIACLAQLVNVIAPIMTENGGKAWAQTIYWPYMHASKFGRGYALNSVLETTRHDTKDFSDVTDIDSIAVWNDENEELTVFAVNRDFEEDNILSINLKDFDGYKPVEHIVLEGFDIKAENTAVNSPVKPVSKILDSIYESVKEINLSPLSWNVIRFKK
ncbi:MAG: alpha-N-arabinofuranosidase, partial [Clostridia bacterium]|nr:alpha-N-arabinofuranosidase [Clostridia bacterium]